MDNTINIEDNPHILLGRGIFASCTGTFQAQFPEDEQDRKMGFLSFHPLNSPVTDVGVRDSVDPDAIQDIENPLVSLVFASPQSAERLIDDIRSVIELMKDATDV